MIHPRSLLRLLCGLLLTATALPAKTLIYGSTPAGIAAAIAAAEEGEEVHLYDHQSEIGGLLTSGLSHTDFHSYESLTGNFLDFSQRVLAYYTEKYGADSPQVKTSFKGTFGEPHVNLLILRRMIAEHPGIHLHLGQRLDTVATEKRQLRSLVFQKADGSKTSASADVFIDATYEGDLMAAAGVAWKMGREGRDETGESLAPETGDSQLQAYNFRLIMTNRADNRLLPAAPAGYRREDFTGLLPILASGKIKTIFGYPSHCIFKAQTPPLPNDKYDINDVSRGLVRLSLPGQNLAWPDGTPAEREKIFQDHLRDQIGLLYFLQNDPEVPEKYRQMAREWGFCKDEFPDTQGLPRELYVREARRMQGRHIFSQQDGEAAENHIRARFHPDAIAMGDYGNNCHGTAREGSRWQGRHTGEFYHPVPPYQIPYGTILPKELDNLLVPVAVSSTHVGFCALRLEPIWASLGQAAGKAAALAHRNQQATHAIDVPTLQRKLHVAGSATIYVSDVLPGHPDFAAVQWWGSLGAYHSLVPYDPAIGPRGAKIHGQYSEAAPAHEVRLDEKMTAPLRERWLALAEKQQIPAARRQAAAQASTRGDFIRALAP